jgi:hypothetical protein
MKTFEVSSVDMYLEAEGPETELLILKSVRIEIDEENGDPSSNSCDNCKPWTSCCDSFR